MNSIMWSRCLVSGKSLSRYVCLFLFLAFFVEITAEERTFVIKGRVKNLDGAVVTLQRMNGWKTAAVGFAVDTVKNGKFLIKGNFPSEELTLCYLDVNAENTPSVVGLAVWLKNGITVKVRGKGPLFPFWQVSSSLPEQREEQRYRDIVKQPYKEYLESIVQRDAYCKWINSKDITTFEKDSLQVLYAVVNSHLDSLYDVMCRKKITYMLDAPVSEVWLREVENISKFYADVYRVQLERLLAQMDSAQRKTVYGRRITANLFPPETVEVGDYMADTDLYDLEGNVHRIADYLGRYILLDIWQQYCVGCVESMSYMQKIEKRNADKLVLMTISVDDEDGWRRPWFVWKMPVAGLNLWDKDGITGLFLRYGSNQYPYYVLISPEGIVLEKCGIKTLDACLKKYGFK